MIISNQAPAIFVAVFPNYETVRPDTYQLFLRSITCINDFIFRLNDPVHSGSLAERGINQDWSLHVSQWWKSVKKFNQGVHPLIQITGATSKELSSLSFDMTPELDIDIIVHIWNEALRILRREV